MDTKFEIKHLLGLQTPVGIMPFDLSANGRYLALQVKSVGRGDAEKGQNEVFTREGVPLDVVGSHVVVVDTETQDKIEPFTVANSSWGAQWSPDGCLLAAYVQSGNSRACLGIWNSESLSVQLWQDVWVHPNFSFEIPRWTPDGKSVIVKILNSSQNEENDTIKKEKIGCYSGVKVKSYEPYDAEASEKQAKEESLDTPEWFKNDQGDLACVDISTGQTDRLLNNWCFRSFRVSPNGQDIALLRLRGYEAKGKGNVWSLAIVPLDGGKIKESTVPIYQSFGNAFNWSPDSGHIAYWSHPGRIFVVSLEDGELSPRDITGNESTNLTGPYNFVDEPPRWSQNSQTLYYLSRGKVWILTTDGKTINNVDAGDIGGSIRSWIVSSADAQIRVHDKLGLPIVVRDLKNQKDQLAYVDLVSGEVNLIKALDGICSYEHPMWQAVQVDGTVLYLIVENASTPQEVWKITELGSVARLTSLNANMDGIALGTAQLVEWRALSGKMVKGALMLPPGYEKTGKIPLIVHVYPDEMPSSRIHRFGFGESGIENAQFLATHGYAVLYPDMPVPDLEPMREFAGLVLTAINRIVDMGIVDPERIGLLGHSFGGYCVLSLLTQTKQFRAGVSLCPGGINMTSFYAQMHWGWFETGQGGLGDTPWGNRSRYIENSPFFYLDRVSAPLLLISGTKEEKDNNQAEETFNALYRLGKPVEWRSYIGEGHHPNDWSEANLIDMCDSIVNWFNEKLKARL
ncbi:MAG: prolyl oligopeptidase family serine peptidase [Gammaproteobacteria bacterium]|nr:prolyl oligopeptidase family serine peptidase [Gammaproteobacteria bacterium]